MIRGMIIKDNKAYKLLEIIINMSLNNFKSQHKIKIASTAIIGDKTIIEDFSVVCDNAVVGVESKIHRNVCIGKNVRIGSRVKIQDNVTIPEGVTIEDGVFVGPSVAFTNDRYPRAINEDGTIKTERDWEKLNTTIKYGASLGANSTILCGITIGEWAMIGAGSVVTKDVPPYAEVIGNPAKIIKILEKND